MATCPLWGRGPGRCWARAVGVVDTHHTALWVPADDLGHFHLPSAWECQVAQEVEFLTDLHFHPLSPGDLEPEPLSFGAGKEGGGEETKHTHMPTCTHQIHVYTPACMQECVQSPPCRHVTRACTDTCRHKTCVYTHVCTFNSPTSTRAHTCTRGAHIFIHTGLQAHVHICMHTQAHLYTHACKHAYMHQLGAGGCVWSQRGSTASTGLAAVEPHPTAATEPFLPLFWDCAKLPQTPERGKTPILRVTVSLGALLSLGRFAARRPLTGGF